MSILKHNSQKGFTLAETIVAIFIFTLLALGVNALFSHIFINYRDRVASLDVIDQARLVAANFTNEIRVAAVGNDGSYPLAQTDDNQIIFYSSYGQSSTTMARIRYYMATNTLYKGVVIPTGSPLTYNLAQEKITAIQKSVVATSTPLFYYYDGNYTGTSTPLVQPINVNQIKYVKINLNILKKSVGAATTSFNIIAGASIRNLKTNLGN